MPLAQKTNQISIPLNEHVDIHVMRLVINPDAGPSKRLDAVEIRQYIKESEVYGHGIVVPAREVKDLVVALNKILEGED